jgi:hypothetical protein
VFTERKHFKSLETDASPRLLRFWYEFGRFALINQGRVYPDFISPHRDVKIPLMGNCDLMHAEYCNMLASGFCFALKSKTIESLTQQTGPKRFCSSTLARMCRTRASIKYPNVLIVPQFVDDEILTKQMQLQEQNDFEPLIRCSMRVAATLRKGSSLLEMYAGVEATENFARLTFGENTMIEFHAFNDECQRTATRNFSGFSRICIASNLTRLVLRRHKNFLSDGNNFHTASWTNSKANMVGFSVEVWSLV